MKTKIELKQEDIKLLMTELEGMEQGTEDFGAKMDLVSEAQKDLKMIQEQAVKFADMQKSLSSFAPSKAVESPEMDSRSIVTPGFVADPKKGFDNSGEMLSMIARQTVGAGNSFSLLPNADHRLQHILEIGMTAGQHNTTNDGLCIPAELDPTINELGLDASDDWFTRFSVSQTSSNAKEIKRSAATTNGGSVGLVVGRAAELATLTSTRAVFEKSTVGVDKLYVYSEVSEEDLEDIAWLESHLVAKAPSLMRIKKGEEVLFGDGVAKALGFTNGADKVTVTRNTAAKVKAEDIVNMKARHLRQRGSAGSFWMVNQAVWGQLPLMTIGDQPVFVTDLTGATDGFLLGMPVFTTEDCEKLGAVGDVYLVNPTAYVALEKVGGTKFASSMHVKFDQDLMAFRWTSRFGGIPMFNSVYTPRNNNGGSAKDTLSNFVVLGTA